MRALKALIIIYIAFNVFIEIKSFGFDFHAKYSSWEIVSYWSQWLLMKLGLLALIGILINRSFFPALVWKLVFLLTVILYFYDFPTDKIFSEAFGKFAGTYLLTYLIVIFPPLAGTFYLGFIENRKTSEVSAPME